MRQKTFFDDEFESDMQLSAWHEKVTRIRHIRLPWRSDVNCDGCN